MTKLDRSIPRSVTNPQNRPTTNAAPTPAAAPVQGAAPVDPAVAITGQTDFAQLTAALAQLQPQAQHVARSADPGALWGAQQQQPSPENLRARFAAASPTERAAIVAQVKASQVQTEGKIADRSDKLEKRWRRMNGAKREVILQQYMDKGGAHPELKAKVDAAQKQAAVLQTKIDEMCKDLKATYPSKTPEEAAARKEKLKAVLAVRNEQREVLNGATDALAADGKKLELLATNEKNIDPNGNITKDGDSLLSMIGQWLGFSQTLTFFDHFLAQNKINLEDQAKKIEQETVEKAIHEGDLRKKMQVKSDLAQRDLLRQLSTRIEGVRKG